MSGMPAHAGSCVGWFCPSSIKKGRKDQRGEGAGSWELGTDQSKDIAITTAKTQVACGDPTVVRKLPSVIGTSSPNLQGRHFVAQNNYFTRKKRPIATNENTAYCYYGFGCLLFCLLCREVMLFEG